MPEFAAALANHTFESLFNRGLGWDRVQSSLSVQYRGSTFALQAVAEKRGFVVFSMATERTVLADRMLLREIQRQVRKTYHEHILIHHCEAPRKQVWQWAATIDDNEIEHHEHPFFSDQPPPRLLERLHGLQFKLEDEGKITLFDVLERVRIALLPQNEFDLFARSPNFAAKSNQLAIAIKQGIPGAFQAFVELHMPLARFWAWMPELWFGMDRDDAEQVAMIGLIEAAKRFDPDLGYQFSTYAFYRIRQACQRHGLLFGLPIHIPDYLFWQCNRLDLIEDDLLKQHGPDGAAWRLDEEIEQVGGVVPEFRVHYLLARRLKRAADLPFHQRQTLEPCDRPADPAELLRFEERRKNVLQELEGLSAREADILRKRHGFDGPDQTLEEVAKPLGLTRERIRQIQAKAEAKLRHRLTLKGFGLGGRGQLVQPDDDEPIAVLQITEDVVIDYPDDTDAQSTRQPEAKLQELPLSDPQGSNGNDA